MPEKTSTTRGGARRRGIKRTLGRQPATWRDLLRSPRFGWALLIMLAYTVTASALVTATRETPRLVEGRLADTTRLARVDFEIEDLVATEQEREIRRRSTPRYYVANRAALDAVRRSLEGLPTALADAETLDQVAEGIRDEFRLDPERLAAIRREAVDGEASAAWRESVRELAKELRTTPLLSREAFQLEMQESNALVELESEEGRSSELPKQQVVNIAGAQLEEAMSRLARSAGFTGAARPMVAEWLTRTARPTYTFDESKTNLRKAERADEVPARPAPRAFESAANALFVDLLNAG